MTRDELKIKLSQLAIRPDAYCFDSPNQSEAYILSFDKKKWRVYYFERGIETGSRIFDSESAANEYLLHALQQDLSTRIINP